MTPAGQALLDEALEGDPPGSVPLAFEVDDVYVVADFPDEVDVALAVDATEPAVSLYDIAIPVEVNEAACASDGATVPPSGDAPPSAPGSAPSGPGVAVAAPLSPKFTG